MVVQEVSIVEPYIILIFIPEHEPIREFSKSVVFFLEECKHNVVLLYKSIKTSIVAMVLCSLENNVMIITIFLMMVVVQLVR